MKAECKTALPLLESYLDDELNGSKRQVVEKHLGDCEGCRAQLALLRQRADMLRAHFDEAIAAADFSGFEDRVLRKLAKEPPLPWGEKLGLWIRETLVHYRAVWITAAATAIVVFALLLPLLGDRKADLTPTPTPQINAPSTSPETQRVAQATPQVDNDVIIDSMEYGGERSMIYNVSRNNTTVIWLVDFDRAGAKDGQGDEL